MKAKQAHFHRGIIAESLMDDIQQRLSIDDFLNFQEWPLNEKYRSRSRSIAG